MRVLVSASDPGGGNAVLPVARRLQQEGDSLTCVIGGASRDIFRAAEIEYIDAQTLPSEPERLFTDGAFNVFVTGTSIGDTLDKRLLMLCKARSIPSLSIIDFWSNYWQRFSSHAKDMRFTSDIICVMDEQAQQEMIGEGFDKRMLLVTGNPYFDHFADGISNDAEDPQRVLFLSQPLREYESYEGGNTYGFDEYAVMSDVIFCFERLGGSLRLVIRLHPRDEKGKYDPVLKPSVCNWSYDDTTDLDLSVSKSGLIMGMNSVVLFQAACAGKAVVSYQPNVKKNVLKIILKGSADVITSKEELFFSLFDYQSGRFVRNKKAVLPAPDATERVVIAVRNLAHL